MADTKISELATAGALAEADLFAIADDPAGTPVSRSLRADALKTYIEDFGEIPPFYATTAAETTAVATIVDTSQLPGTPNRYKVNASQGVTDMDAAVQKAVDVSELTAGNLNLLAETYLCNPVIDAKIGILSTPGTTLLGATAASVVTCQADGVMLSGALNIDGNSVSVNGWLHEGANDCDIPNLNIQNAVADGLYVLGTVGDGAYRNRFKGILSKNNGTVAGTGSDGATAETTNFNSASYTFSSDDVGRRVVIFSGADEGSHLITAFVDPSNVTINEAFTATTSSISFAINYGSGIRVFGTDVAERANVNSFSGLVAGNAADGIDLERAVACGLSDMSFEQNITGYGIRLTECTKAAIVVRGGWIESASLPDNTHAEGGIFQDATSLHPHINGMRINVARPFMGAGLTSPGNTYMLDSAAGVLTIWMQTIGQNLQSPYLVTPVQWTRASSSITGATNAIPSLFSGQSYNNNGEISVATEAQLPAAVDGLNYRFTRNAGGFAFRITPDGTDIIRNAGTAGGPGKHVSLDTNAGSISIECSIDGIWEIVAINAGTISFEA